MSYMTIYVLEVELVIVFSSAITLFFYIFIFYLTSVGYIHVASYKFNFQNCNFLSHVVHLNITQLRTTVYVLFCLLAG